MIILDVPKSVEKDRATKAVRSNSKLPPEIRAILERDGYKREYQQKLLDDGIRKKQMAVAPDNGRSRTKYDACIGMPLHSDIFIKRLMQLNPALWFEQSIARPEMIGIYIRCKSTLEHPETRQYLFAFHSGIMPEFALEKDPGEDGEGVGILRQGYRTILVRLIQRRLITLAQAELLFGPPSHDSAFWAALTGKRNLTQKELYG